MEFRLWLILLPMWKKAQRGKAEATAAAVKLAKLKHIVSVETTPIVAGTASQCLVE